MEKLLFQTVREYLDNRPDELPEDVSREKRFEIERLIARVDVEHIIYHVFLDPRNKGCRLPVVLFEVWGYIAAMAGRAEDMETIFVAMLENPKCDGRAVIQAFRDAYHADVILSLIHGFVFDWPIPSTTPT